MTAPRPSRRLRLGAPGQWGFVVFMLALTGLFVMLGLWQVQRLAEKQAEIATVAARVGETPVAFPEAALWPAVAPEAFDYRPVGLVGRFEHGLTVLVFDNLTDPRGVHGGVGYWVMAPFFVEDGGLVWVNRGFVPDTMAQAFASGGMGPEGLVAIEGLARRPERANPFTPGSDLARRREWVRDPERLALFLPENAGPVAPVTVDLAAGETGALPQGGETVLSFPNRHLEYAGTWFAFAAITPIMLGFWLWRQRRPAKLAENSKGK